jgi:hypothetical protein
MLDMIHDIFGPDLDEEGLVIPAASNPTASRCQTDIAKQASKCWDAKLKEFNKCKKRGLGGTLPFSRASDLERCMGLDTNGKIAKACDTKLAQKISGRCTGVDTVAAFPGCKTGDPGELGSCVDRLVECQVCLALNQADGLGKDCDLFDDTLDNDSCP